MSTNRSLDTTQDGGRPATPGPRANLGGREMRPFVGIAWDGPKLAPPGGGLGGRMALARKARTGAPGKTRTSNPQIRSLVLYPIELRAQPRAAV